MSQFRNLAFEGGGVKGIAYAGALQVLEKNGVLKDIRRVAGTSAGAITAVLVALGASSDHVFRIVGGTNFRSFMDDSFGVLRDSDRLIKEYGWYRGDAFSDWMQKQVHALAQDSGLTFQQLAKRAEKDPSRYRELFIVGTNLTLQLPTVYSAETTPDMPIWQAARISMSIPLFFAAVKGTGRQVLVDGGVTWNYPLDLFDDSKFKPAAGAGIAPGGTVYDANHVYNKETLGLRADTHDEIEAEKQSWSSPPKKIDDFFDYLKALVGYMNDMANKLHLKSSDWHRTIALDASGISATDFNLTDEMVKKLMANGVKGTTEYFDWFNNPAADPKPLNRV